MKDMLLKLRCNRKKTYIKLSTLDSYLSDMEYPYILNGNVLQIFTEEGSVEYNAEIVDGRI